MSKLFRILWLSALVVVPVTLLGLSLWLIDPPVRVAVLTFGLFGLWTLACIGFGAWIEHGRQYGKPPIPGLPNNFDAASMFRWLKDGDNNDEPPLDEQEPEQRASGYQL